MATIDPLHEELIALADSFAVQVRSDEADRAAGALQTVAAELERLTEDYARRGGRRLWDAL